MKTSKFKDKKRPTLLDNVSHRRVSLRTSFEDFKKIPFVKDDPLLPTPFESVPPVLDVSDSKGVITNPKAPVLVEKKQELCSNLKNEALLEQFNINMKIRYRVLVELNGPLGRSHPYIPLAVLPNDLGNKSVDVLVAVMSTLPNWYGQQGRLKAVTFKIEEDSNTKKSMFYSLKRVPLSVLLEYSEDGVNTFYTRFSYSKQISFFKEILQKDNTIVYYLDFYKVVNKDSCKFSSVKLKINKNFLLPSIYLLDSKNAISCILEVENVESSFNLDPELELFSWLKTQDLNLKSPSEFINFLPSVYKKELDLLITSGRLNKEPNLYLFLLLKFYSPSEIQDLIDNYDVTFDDDGKLVLKSQSTESCNTLQSSKSTIVPVLIKNVEKSTIIDSLAKKTYFDSIVEKNEIDLLELIKESTPTTTE